MTTILELRAIIREYPSRSGVLRVLNSADLTLEAGALVGLVGPSGSGKSTLLHTAGLLEQPQSGTVLFENVNCSTLGDGERTRLRRQKLGFIYQFHHLLPEFDACDNVAMVLMAAGQTRRMARQQAAILLDDMGLGERLHHQPGQLSGGEQQRVAIARALINKPRLIIADEPTGNLDSITAQNVFENLTRMARAEGVAVLIATHNMTFCPYMDRVLTIRDGKLGDLT